MQHQTPPVVTVMDTTLRDGEQTPGVSFDSDDKLDIARALLEGARVDRIEIGSARVSAGELESARRVARWADGAGVLDRVELLGFCDGQRSVDWIRRTGVQHMNLVVKGSEHHCRGQLGLDLDGHLAGIETTLGAASRAGISVRGVYLEDWSRGVVESGAYVERLMLALGGLGVRRVYLADTLGVLDPLTVVRQVRRMRRRFPELALEFHGHDDYGLATANALAAVHAGAAGVHATVNGLGERAGDTCLSEIVVALRDHGRRSTSVDEQALAALSERVARASGHPVPHNAPIVGRDVFTQTAGVHADGDAKGGLYASRLAPERFGRRREYALGKLAGASLLHHLRELGVALAPEGGGEGVDALLAELLAKVVARGDAKRAVTSGDLLELVEAARKNRLCKAALSVTMNSESSSPDAER